MDNNLRLGRIFGIEIGINWSLVFIFVLIAWSLALGVFAPLHPTWGPVFIWGLAIGGTILFFASLLQHGTPPNQSPERRWAIQYHYAARSCTRISRREHAALYFDGDLYAGCQAPTGTRVADLTD